jgi:heterotetrameric sarcosine oxidase delta subunit
MLLIPCPWCGPRDETEFHSGGEAHRIRPIDPSAIDNKAWGDFLFMRENIKGWQGERWYHQSGCRRWFVLERDTVTHAIAPLADGSIQNGEGEPA